MKWGREALRRRELRVLAGQAEDLALVRGAELAGVRVLRPLDEVAVVLRAGLLGRGRLGLPDLRPGDHLRVLGDVVVPAVYDDEVPVLHQSEELLLEHGGEPLPAPAEAHGELAGRLRLLDEQEALLVLELPDPKDFSRGDVGRGEIVVGGPPDRPVRLLAVAP